MKTHFDLGLIDMHTYMHVLKHGHVLRNGTERDVCMTQTTLTSAKPPKMICVNTCFRSGVSQRMLTTVAARCLVY